MTVVYFLFMIVSLLNLCISWVFYSWKVQYFTSRSKLLDIKLLFLVIRNRGHPNCLFVHLLLSIPLKFWYVWRGQTKLRYVIIWFLTRAVVILPHFDFVVLILVIYICFVCLSDAHWYTLYFFLSSYVPYWFTWWSFYWIIVNYFW